MSKAAHKAYKSLLPRICCSYALQRGLQVSSKRIDAILSDLLFICEFLMIFLAFSQWYVY